MPLQRIVLATLALFAGGSGRVRGSAADPSSNRQLRRRHRLRRSAASATPDAGLATGGNETNPRNPRRLTSRRLRPTTKIRRRRRSSRAPKRTSTPSGTAGVGKGVNLYSLEREIALGKQAAMEVEKSSKLINDPVVTEYVNRIGQNLVRNSDAKVPFTIKVIDSDEINAFALPGGFFYVNSGLILRADEEAELAGVMGHEIAHVAARHGTKNATKGEIAQFATIPLILLGPGGWAGYGLYEGLNVAIPLGFLKFSRDNEREADYLGLQYMYKAGYDPNAFVSFFEKIEAEERRHPGSIPKVFSTHPPTPDRVQKTQEEIATILPARGRIRRDDVRVRSGQIPPAQYRKQEQAG